MLCRSLQDGLGCQSHEQGQVDKETREAVPKGRREAETQITVGVSPRAPALCVALAGSPQGAHVPSCVKGMQPLPATSSRGRCALLGERPQEGFAHCKALSRCDHDYYNPPPPDGTVAPFSACQEAPLSSPRGCKGPTGPWLPPGPPGSAWASLQLTASFFRCRDPSSCQRAAPLRGTSRGGVRGGSGNPGTKAGWELAGRHQGSMHNGPGGWRLRSWPAFA